MWRYYLPCSWYIHQIPFWCCVIPTKIQRKTFCACWRIFNAILSTCTVAFCTTHGQNNTRKCYTEGFIPVASLNGVVGSPSLFIRYLIGRTRKIWSVVYINEKWIYVSKTLACTIRECAIVHNVLHVTWTCPFIYDLTELITSDELREFGILCWSMSR